MHTSVANALEKYSSIDSVGVFSKFCAFALLLFGLLIFSKWQFCFKTWRYNFAWRKISVFDSKRLSHLINAGEARCLASTVAAVDPPVPPILGSGHRHQILPLVLLAHFNGGAEVVNRPLVSESLARRRRRRRAPSGAPRPSSGAGRRLLGHAGHAIIIGDSRRRLMVRGSWRCKPVSVSLY